MKLKATNFYKYSVLFALICATFDAFAAGAPSARSATNVVSAPRMGVTESRRNNATVSNTDTQTRSAVRRNAKIVNRSTVAPLSASTKAAFGARLAQLGVGVRQNLVPARSATGNHVVRSATHIGDGRGNVKNGASRASRARATAVFDDVSKMGGGYATCRDAYSTCMDQLCAKANDTYRRCICSSRFAEFRNTESALDQAKMLLMQFEDNNLNAVDKSAAEVNAMYSATVGEQAIKNDTSGAQQILSQVSDLLSGKKVTTTQNTNTSGSLGILSFDFSADVDDIWGGSSNSLFADSNSGTDLSQLEGLDLYNKAHAQCVSLVADACENNAALNMTKSSYSILITQDCNAYEKKIDTQREAVKQTVRTAEKYLRDARLEEYRSHNSADVNECISKVRTAVLQDTACGANYKRCLDYSGVYINSTTGEAIYSQRLFELTNQIKLDGTANVLGANPDFDKFLDSKRIFATGALETCRDMADTVWSEFKRSALIEIAQAQDAMIEDVKSSCVSTMKECYDTQSDALKSFDDTTAQTSSVLAAYASRAMCEDKVLACSTLYGDPDGCKMGNNGKLVDNGTRTCGLKSLQKLVDTVDNVRVAEGCATAIESYVQELCKPQVGDQAFPWNCRLLEPGNKDATDTTAGNNNAKFATLVRKFALDNCSNPNESGTEYSNDNIVSAQTKVQVRRAIEKVEEELDYQLADTCESMDGQWVSKTDANYSATINDAVLPAFYSTVYGNVENVSWGRCLQDTVKMRCLSYNSGEEEPVATYDAAKQDCVFTAKWYENQCEAIGGVFENSNCYIMK